MNLRSKLLFLLINRNNNQGIALPFALGIGVVMMLAGTFMIVRSQSNQSYVQAQQSTAESMNAAEVGATRIFALLNENRYLAMYPDCESRDSDGVCSDTGTTPSWANAINVPTLTVCEAGKATEVRNVALNNETWLAIDPNNAKQGEYRLLSYEYANPGVAPGEGKLTVEGRIRGHNDLNSSVSQLTVEIPVSPGPVEGMPIPGVWLDDDPDNATGNNGIKGDVLIGNCNLTKAQLEALNVVDATDPETGQKYKARHTNLEFPDLPEIPSTAIDLGVVGENKDGTVAGVTGDITLPRDEDTPVSKTINNRTVDVYEYKVEDINFDSGSHSLTVEPGKKVTLYLNGSMVVKANSGIIHSCDDDGTPIAGCLPTDFQIYGYGDATNTICTAGNKRIEAFIFAPKYAVGTAGTGGGQGGIKGTVWAKEWSNGKSCGSETSNTAVVQTARWEDLGIEPTNTPPVLSNQSSWKRNQR